MWLPSFLLSHQLTYCSKDLIIKVRISEIFKIFSCTGCALNWHLCGNEHSTTDVVIRKLLPKGVIEIAFIFTGTGVSFLPDKNCVLCLDILSKPRHLFPVFPKDYMDFSIEVFISGFQRSSFWQTDSLYPMQSRSSHPEVFLGKGVLKVCSKFTGEHPCRSVISIKLLNNFIEITLRRGRSPINLLHI